MRRAAVVAVVAAIVALGACGSNPPPAAVPSPPPSGAAAAGSAVENVSLADVGLNADLLDRKADPCDDFYQFACGNWLAKKAIPADRPSTGTFDEIFERNEAVLHDLLETAAKTPGSSKIGDYYAACMDEPAVEKSGAAPLQPLLAQVKKVHDAKSFMTAVAGLHGNGIRVLFALRAVQDKKDATQMIAEIGQSGILLPDRDYYLDDKPEAKTLRDTYRAHLERAFALIGRKDGKRAAADTLAVETAIAKTHKTRVELRDEQGTYNRIERAGLVKAAPKLDWSLYFSALGVPDVDKINAESTHYVESFDALVQGFTWAQWQNYLTAHVVDGESPVLAKRFVDEKFALGKLVFGLKEQRVRWKRCIAFVDTDLGELLNGPFVDKSFVGDSKERALALIEGIAKAFGQNLERITWMDDATKAKAKDKLKKIALHVGYPDKPRSYDFPIGRTSLAENDFVATRAEVARKLRKIGKPVDRDEWGLTAPTVNAYYNPSLNEEVFPAGILQPPFYSVKATEGVNFAAIGMFMGHELTHGFDDQGAQYDGDGNLSGWWPEKVVSAFKEKTECVAARYSQYEPLPGLHLNGHLTNGENIADMGGIKMAFTAYRASRKDAKTVKVADGFSEDQQFFLAYGQAWCEKSTDEFQKFLLTVDPHSPGRYRIIGPLSQLQAFADAWKCPVGSKMHTKDVCEVW